MVGARTVGSLLFCLAMLLHLCRSQDCLKTISGRVYLRTLASEETFSCRGEDRSGSSTACACAQFTEEQGLNTFRLSEDGGCRAFQVVPEVAGEEASGTVVVYVAEEPTGDTAVPEDNGPTIEGLELSIVNLTELVAVWDGVGDYQCAVGGYRVRFNDDEEAIDTTELSASVAGIFNPLCEQYSVAVTALDEEGNEFGTPSTAYSDAPPYSLIPVYNLECCSPPFVETDVGCVFPYLCPMSFAEARAQCQLYGADLYSSDTVQDTLDLVIAMAEILPDGGVGASWVGVERSGASWTWLGNGREVESLEWTKIGFTSCPVPVPNADCVLLTTLQDPPLCNTVCDLASPFICRAPDVGSCIA